MLRSGKIFLGLSDIAIDCVIWDKSSLGLLAKTKVPTAVPEQVRIEITDVGTFHAIRRWVVGDFIGFEFIGDQSIRPDAAQERQHFGNPLKKRPKAERLPNAAGYSEFWISVDGKTFGVLFLSLAEATKAALDLQAQGKTCEIFCRESGQVVMSFDGRKKAAVA